MEGASTYNDLRRSLAVYFLNLSEDERLLSVRELAKKYDVSVGAISQAISGFDEDGAVRINRHGHLGSFIEARSLVKLWNIAVNEPIVIAHTLPSNRRYEGLVTGLKSLLGQAGIGCYMIFVRGSLTRIRALRERKCHVAIISSFAADGLCSDREEIALRLPAGTFTKEHKVFYRTGPAKLSRPHRIAVDYDSFDQYRLTELEFEKQGVEFKEITFMNILRLLKEGDVEAAIWTEDDMEAYLGSSIASRPLSDEVQEIVGDRSTSASLVIRSDDDATRAVIKGTLEVSALLEIQQSVIEGEIIPEY